MDVFKEVIREESSRHHMAPEIAPDFPLSRSHFSLALASFHSKALVEVVNDVGHCETALQTKPKGGSSLGLGHQVVHLVQVGHVSQAARLDRDVLLLPAGKVDALLTAAPPPPPHLPAALRPLQQARAGGWCLLLHGCLAALLVGDQHAGDGDGEGQRPRPPQKPLPGGLPPLARLLLHLDDGERQAVKRGGLPLLGKQQVRQNWCLLQESLCRTAAINRDGTGTQQGTHGTGSNNFTREPSLPIQYHPAKDPQLLPRWKSLGRKIVTFCETLSRGSTLYPGSTIQSKHMYKNQQNDSNAMMPLAKTIIVFEKRT